MGSKYTCFLHPQPDFSDKNLEDPCPKCGRPYGFPLHDYPGEIGSFTGLEPLNRGFYSAAYVSTDPLLGLKRVLKVCPKSIYEKFNKNFYSELKAHARMAEDTQHLVKVVNGFDADLTFGDVTLPCHVAVLEYIDGETLESILESAPADARTLAQIGVDLFRILAELRGHEGFHNDLHEGNLIVARLRGGARRADALNDSIRVVAIDLNSSSDDSKSDETRRGDIHWVAVHLKRIADQLLATPEKIDEIDYRLASLLHERAHLMSPKATSQRVLSPEECIEDIRAAFQQVASPWSAPPRLRHFGDYYNAQTLAPWYVPLLLVDPEESWLTRVSSPGPQIVTGMRGCGKTMLLRALELHARAAPREQEPESAPLDRLGQDGYVGIYASATRLLNPMGASTPALRNPFEVLFAAYCLAGIRAVRHVAELSLDSVVSSWYNHLAQVLNTHLDSDVDWSSIGSEYELERRIHRVLVALGDETCGYRLRSHPSTAFPDLAEYLTRCCSIWSDKYVLFLLDDVSTRYVDQEQIEEIVSALLFQDIRCAFKLTSEAQTLELVLRSPGQIEKARVGRDYEVFDLGSEVYEKIKSRGRLGGRDFVESILSRRAKYYSSHPTIRPKELLGDASLESIGRLIATTSRSARKKKEAYHGLTALARVCVGDIGDIISLYDVILKRGEGKGRPIPRSIQSECYQEFCSRRLYDLNRRNGELKDFALGFAEASHELLMKSHRDIQGGQDSRRRLRQYLSIYVRITTGDVEMQYEKLRDLIDSGVFVFAGGSEAPRTKTHDSDPIQQFKLTYRKIYGLSNFIGLAESDRFELSGSDLEDWLLHPDQGRVVLLRNLGAADRGEGGQHEEDEIETEAVGASAERVTGEFPPSGHQVSLFEPSTAERDQGSQGIGDGIEHIHTAGESALARAMIRARSCDLDEVKGRAFDVVVAGLGFESRTLASLRRLLAHVKARTVMLVKYPEPGKRDEIRRLIAGKGLESVEVDYQDFLRERISFPSGSMLVDVTGLMKPALFHAVRWGMEHEGSVWIAHTAAQSYYPLDSEIAAVLDAEEAGNQYDLLESLTDIMTGEAAPYIVYRLLSSDSDESRRRVLVAFASPKHERLLTLLDERAYDRLELVIPAGSSSRVRLARIVAEVAGRNYPSTEIAGFESNDLAGILEFLSQSYRRWYVERGFNFELGLTGSKLQAVAAACLSAVVKTSQALYVAPASWDANRFTKGVGESRLYELRLHHRKIPE